MTRTDILLLIGLLGLLVSVSAAVRQRTVVTQQVSSRFVAVIAELEGLQALDRRPLLESPDNLRETTGRLLARRLRLAQRAALLSRRLDRRLVTAEDHATVAGALLSVCHSPVTVSCWRKPSVAAKVKLSGPT